MAIFDLGNLCVARTPAKNLLTSPETMNGWKVDTLLDNISIVSKPGNASLWYDHCPKLSKDFKKPFSLLFEKSPISPLYFGVTTEVIRFSKSAWSS